MRRMSQIIIDQSYVPRDFWDRSDPKITESIIQSIINITKEKGMKSPIELKVLDVGSGDGNFSFAIEKYVKKVVAVEPDKMQNKVGIEKRKKKRSKVIMHKTLIENFSTNERFDLILCLTVLEHMPNASRSFDRIFKLMNKGSLIYLTVPNKLWPYEYHYKLLFLSWLPLPLANLYVRIFHRGDSFVDSSYAPTYFGIKRFFTKYPCKYEFVPPDESAAYLGLGIPTPRWYSIMQNLGIKLLHIHPFFWFFSKSFIMVITKK